MLEFEILQELEPNAEILEIIKDYDYAIKNGKIKHLKATNLQFTQPTEYVITEPYHSCHTWIQSKWNQ